MDSVTFLQRFSFSAYIKVTTVEKIVEISQGISNNSETEAKELHLTEFYPLTLLRLHQWKRLYIRFCTSAVNSGIQTTEWKHATQQHVEKICIRHVETESTCLVHLPGKECLLQ